MLGKCVCERERMKRRERGLSTIVIILERRFSVQSSHDAATRVDSGSHHNEKTLLWLNYGLFNFNSYECNFMGREVVVVHLNNNYTNFAITLDRPAHVHAPYRFDSGTQTAHTQSHSLSLSRPPTHPFSVTDHITPRYHLSMLMLK